MVGLLTSCRSFVGVLAALASTALAAEEDRHQWLLEVDLDYVSASSSRLPWTEGGLGKLRYEDGSALSASRILLDYQTRLKPTLFANLTLDYVDDASSGLDIAEAFLEWRPVPRSALEQRWRFGAVYPPFSLENGERGWSSPFTSSFSAINSWLAEEVRPVGAEWSFARRIGSRGSPQRLGGFAGAFYGNDPAGTFLFWRGFSVHDRQSRLGDRLPLPPIPIFGPDGVTGYRDLTLEPFAETDHEPGYYAGLEWRYAARALLKFATYDNRADPASFSDGQWGWRTKFRHLAGQFSLPAGFGLVMQWMQGETYWFIATTPQGMLTPASRLVRDDFDASFALITKRLAPHHRISLRYDRFEISRDPDLEVDAGNAWTLAYRFDPQGRIGWSFEYLRIESHRDIWPWLYGLPADLTEKQLRVQMNLRLGPRS